MIAPVAAAFDAHALASDVGETRHHGRRDGIFA